MTTSALDSAKLDAFLSRVVGDFGAILSSAAAAIGDALGLYRAMADGTPVTSTELANKTGLHERYIGEWLLNQAAAGYVEYDPPTRPYRLPPEHAEALTNEHSP